MTEKPKGVAFRSDDEGSPYRFTFPNQRPGPWLTPIDPGYHVSDKPRVDRPRREARRRAEKKKETRSKRHSPQFRVALRGRLVTRQLLKRLRREGLI